MKKIITVLMIMVICINWGLSIKLGVTEAASVSNEICEAIREELSFCESVKSSFGMKDVEFEELYVGQKAIAFMNSKYSMAYVYSCGLMPNDGLIISNIQQGYPLYGHAVVYYNLETTNHAVTIYGINAVAGRLMVMDPNFGSTTAYYRQGTTGLGDDTQLHYRYIDPSTNAEIAILHASCRYW